MNLEFKAGFINIIDGTNEAEVIDTEKIDNNILYKLMLRCSDADNINFLIDDTATPFARKLYEILEREFNKE
jgi:hypothetical protein